MVDAQDRFVGGVLLYAAVRVASGVNARDVAPRRDENLCAGSRAYDPEPGIVVGGVSSGRWVGMVRVIEGRLSDGRLENSEPVLEVFALGHEESRNRRVSRVEIELVGAAEDRDVVDVSEGLQAGLVRGITGIPLE